ncbi:MAG TPA: UDP-N-acetylmuramate dehydrogenase [Candidatus Babeliales bacterium]|jgi:UDP-N-acetylmuramate dehydrogenase|nr:UDP-N-acetylmuramate dehydrogenase [Candidatus Babeliales bacterium]
MHNTSAPATLSIDLSPKNLLIQTNIPLADKNWFGTGGPARFYCAPMTVQQFQEAIIYAAQHNFPIFILGQGANILVSDEGFDGLVIRPTLTTIETLSIHDGAALVKAGAGVTMPNLIDYCLNNNLIGLEEFSGIPGTVGGSVYINLHYFNFLLAQFLVSAEIIHKKNGTLETVDAQWFNFGYNDSQLHKKDYFLINATFNLKVATAEETAFAQGRKTEIIRHRAHRYPQVRTCGSFFRNFFANEVTLEIEHKKIIFVAYYLDKIGVKGSLRKGDAIVSPQHANMIINMGNATSSDIITLAHEMQQLVLDTFNIVPQPECQLIGFKKYPLLR